VDDLWWMTGIPNEIIKAMKIGEKIFPTKCVLAS